MNVRGLKTIVPGVVRFREPSEPLEPLVNDWASTNLTPLASTVMAKTTNIRVISEQGLEFVSSRGLRAFWKHGFSLSCCCFYGTTCAGIADSTCRS